jgi:uncharacterized damage-inducible protein DinB
MSQPLELQLLLQSFERNGRVNQAILEALTEEDLATSDDRGGWSIGQHLGHIAEFRHEWLARISPAHAEELPPVIDRDKQGVYLLTHNLDDFDNALTTGDSAALAAVFSALDENRLFEVAYQSHPASFLQHIMIHDAHHRGQMASLMRQGGRPKEQMDEFNESHWSIWRE